jgi:hypothetical protein
MNLLMFLKSSFLFLLFLILFTKSYSQSLRPVEANGKWGYVGKDNEWAVKPKFENAKKFSEGMAPVKIKGKWGYIGESGKVAIKPIYSNVNEFSEGLAAVEVLTQQGPLWGYIDLTGVMRIQPQFTKAEPFKNKQALVSAPEFQLREYTLIEPNGNRISPPYIKRIPSKNNTFKLVTSIPNSKDSMYCYVDEKGTLITQWYLNNFHLGQPQQKVSLPSKNDNSGEPNFDIKEGYKTKLYAYMDANGKIISDWFEEIEPFVEGYAPIKKNNRYGFINQQYELVCQPTFISVKYLTLNRYGALMDNDAFVLINEKGDVLSPKMMRYDYFYGKRFFGFYNLVEGGTKKTKKALFDVNGKQQSQWFIELFPSSNFITRGYDYMDYTLKGKPTKTGLWYNYFNDTCSEMLTTWRLNHLYKWQTENKDLVEEDSILQRFHAPGINYPIDKAFFKNLFYLEFELDLAKSTIHFSGGDFHDGMALISEHKVGESQLKMNGITFTFPSLKYGFIDWNGRQTIACTFDYVSGFSDGKAIVRELFVNTNGKTEARFGAINYLGKVIIKPQFELMGQFGSGLAPVYSKKEMKWGFVTTTGKLQMNYQYDDVRPFRYGMAAVKKENKWGLINTKGDIILDFEYKKAPIPKSEKTVEVLQDGIGYEVISI